MQPNILTEIIVILEHAGFMQSIAPDAIGSFNGFLAADRCLDAADAMNFACNQSGTAAGLPGLVPRGARMESPGARSGEWSTLT